MNNVYSSMDVTVIIHARKQAKFDVHLKPLVMKTMRAEQEYFIFQTVFLFFLFFFFITEHTQVTPGLPMLQFGDVDIYT